MKEKQYDMRPFRGRTEFSLMPARAVLSFLEMDSARHSGIRRSVLGQRRPLVACHAFVAPRVVASTVPVHARTPQSRAGVPCASTDGSRLAQTDFPLPSEMLANCLQSSVTATFPEPAMLSRALGRRWTAALDQIQDSDSLTRPARTGFSSA